MSQTTGYRRIRKRLSIPLLVAAGLLVYITFAPTPSLVKEVAPPAVSARSPDSYAWEVSVNDFDEQGALQGNTTAQALRRFPNEGIVELDAPKRRNFTADGQWFASAQRGQLRETTEVLVLEQDVRLQYDSNSVQFLTERMIINMPKQAARSTSSVRIWQANSETLAEQIYINLDRQIASLSGAVNTVYVPEG